MTPRKSSVPMVIHWKQVGLILFITVAVNALHSRRELNLIVVVFKGELFTFLFALSWTYFLPYVFIVSWVEHAHTFLSF